MELFPTDETESIIKYYRNERRLALTDFYESSLQSCKLGVGLRLFCLALKMAVVVVLPRRRNGCQSLNHYRLTNLLSTVDNIAEAVTLIRLRAVEDACRNIIRVLVWISQMNPQRPNRIFA
ncbi:hypothetical protein Zmor_024823 [Zophobas morio]|jgi:hypothetical protein|uniref:Uncharacterized protein n=1 Tax=Zophobas morio TaxID=2755281 RepID=A0AA38M012_9CUCU|nr:hypothetical protein Zmor_024823 [Zophobas morio]